MFRGEFESMTAIHKLAPGFVPRPIAWGQCRDEEDTFFFISEFVDMERAGKLPDAESFCKALANLHHNSVSPTGKFGFDVPTCNGDIPQNNEWESSWELFFANGMRHMLNLDLEANGHNPELKRAMEPIFANVIPRLLRPLEQGPHPIRPVLLHGDLWYGNCSTTQDTRQPVIFDASSFYGHNEYELGNWRPKRNLFTRNYMEAYKKSWDELQSQGGEVADKRAAEFEDRIMLYELRFNFHYCIMVPGLENIKKTMIENMNFLAAKYPAPDIS
ncbi:hypothetical protein NLG97_g7851 [Lecanicillium saksenae]|uniref:Uncharacterized protein n=1 Tax=Lecanicillium saksenae TaxID=468837 RepID=A0ACC1QKQ0_9HYPO|nr:hypothetical protein NLG97_g7851 [Lecanicillium saksenae]